MRRIVASITIVIAFLFSGCLHIGDASPDEKSQLDSWSKLVTDADRAQVQRAAASHTEWAEKKKVQWMITQYRTRYNRAQAKKAATQAATRASTQSMTSTTQK